MTEEKNKEMEYEDDEEIGEAAELAAKIKKIKGQLKQCQKEKQEYLTGWQRSQADFINYKRRQEEQMAEWLKMFSGGLLRDILPVLDTLDASIKNSDNATGLEAVKDQLLKILKQHGLEEIKSVGEKFNPEWHEAIEQVEAAGDEGVIAEEAQKGYMLNGKILRVAKVKVKVGK